MSLDKAQFRDLINRTLEHFDPVLSGPRAVNLLLGTAAVESNFGTYLRQVGGGPARGFFQMEPSTFEWLKEEFKSKYPVINHWVFGDQETNITQAIIMCRLRYRVVPKSLPEENDSEENDVAGIATYWKYWYNTMEGKGKISDFVKKYRRYVA